MIVGHINRRWGNRNEARTKGGDGALRVGVGKGGGVQWESKASNGKHLFLKAGGSLEEARGIGMEFSTTFNGL